MKGIITIWNLPRSRLLIQGTEVQFIGASYSDYLVRLLRKIWWTVWTAEVTSIIHLEMQFRISDYRNLIIFFDFFGGNGDGNGELPKFDFCIPLFGCSQSHQATPFVCFAPYSGHYGACDCYDCWCSAHGDIMTFLEVPLWESWFLTGIYLSVISVDWSSSQLLDDVHVQHVFRKVVSSSHGCFFADAGSEILQTPWDLECFANPSYRTWGKLPTSTGERRISSINTRWWFQIFFMFILTWGRWSNLTCAYFSDGLGKNHQTRTGHQQIARRWDSIQVSGFVVPVFTKPTWNRTTPVLSNMASWKMSPPFGFYVRTRKNGGKNPLLC